MSVFDPRRPSVSIIMPVLEEAGVLRERLDGLQSDDPWHEIIIVDGGSRDATAASARAWAAGTAGDDVHVLETAPGRARQMNAGAAQATGDALLFLHVDTRLPQGALELVRSALRTGAVWGRFDVRIDARERIFRVIERAMNLRSALSGLATGDQAIFVRADVFRMLGGYAPIALMEDIELCARLKWVGPPVRIRQPALTSDRRWRSRGVLRTILSMWTLRALYSLGVSPQRLARVYPHVR